ncbi:MAG: GGDEF domain-containing protein [Actinomycetota bacterium]|nr:GGDEF domain-containing protein [Actinomycetota bacterium]
MSHRGLLITTALIGYATVFANFMLFETPGLGIGHFYYVSVALVALATGAWWGAAAGLLADALYACGIVLNPKIPSAEVLSTSTGIRLVTFAAMGALIGWFAQNNRQLVEHLRTAADRDFLTDLLNTRAFDGRLEARLELAKPFGLVLGDMDGLKEINDNEGHAVGNDVLRRAAEVLKTVVRAEDELARVGGDEFAVLTSLPGTDQVRALCGRLTAALASEGIAMTFGWAVNPRDGRDALALFRAADERLYAQKLIRRRLIDAEIVQFPAARESYGLRSIR